MVNAPRLQQIALVVVGLVVFGTSGLSLFSTPAYETTYGCDILPAQCVEGSCYRPSAVVVGNSGSMKQSAVEVDIPNSVLERARTGIKVYGLAAPREHSVEEKDEVTTVKIFNIERGHEARVSLLLEGKPGERFPSCDTLTSRIQPSKGSLLPGRASSTRFMRLLFRLFV